MGHYDEDLAYIHDAGFGELAESAAAHITELLRRRGFAGGRVVELGCGSGITAARLGDAGFSVVGIDQSRALLALARRRAPRAEFLEGSFVTAAVPPCVAVVSIGEVLNYRFDRRGGRAALERLFARVQRSLVPGGIFVFDVAGPGRIPAGRARTWHAGEDWAILVDAVEDAQSATLTRRITSFRRVRGAWRRDDETHELLLHRPAALARTLRSNGFRVRILRSYGDEPFAPGHRVVIARRYG